MTALVVIAVLLALYGLWCLYKDAKGTPIVNEKHCGNPYLLNERGECEGQCHERPPCAER